jgi:type IV secretory pathway VirB10-like protein
VSELSINLKLGRVAMAHTAVSGLHLEQDEQTRLWRVSTRVPSQSWLRRLSQTVRSRRAAKIGLALGTVLMAVAFAAIFSYVPSAGILRNDPPLALQPPPPEIAKPTSIEVAKVPFPEGTFGTQEASPLPAPMFEAALNSAPVLPAMPLSRDKVKSAQVIPPSAPVGAQKPKQEAPMAVFSEPPPSSPVASSDAVKTPARAEPVDQSKNQLPKQRPLELASSPANPPSAPTSKTPDMSGDAGSATARTNGNAIRILAVANSESIVVTNPTTRLPIVIKVGESLPDGTVLKSVDKAASTAQNSRGETLSLR